MNIKMNVDINIDIDRIMDKISTQHNCNDDISLSYISDDEKRLNAETISEVIKNIYGIKVDAEEQSEWFYQIIDLITKKCLCISSEYTEVYVYYKDGHLHSIV